MNYQLLLVLCLHVKLICSVPIQLLLPMQYGMPQVPFLRQMVPSDMNPPVVIYPQRPVMILLPKTSTSTEDNDRYKNLNEHKTENLKSNPDFIDEDSEAIILDAEPNSLERDIRKTAILRRNQERLSIGNIISYIPFLPIEINVPDSISWIIDLITSIGNRNPFRPQNPGENMQRISSKGPVTPILVMPLGGSMSPMQI